MRESHRQCSAGVPAPPTCLPLISNKLQLWFLIQHKPASLPNSHTMLRNTLGIVSQRRPSGRQVFKAKDTRGRKAAKGIQPPWARLRCHCCNLQREGAAPEPVLQAGQSSPCQERLAGTGTVRAVTLHPFTSCHGTHPAPRHHCHHQDSQPPLCTEASLFSAPQSTGEFYSVIHSITKTS